MPTTTIWLENALADGDVTPLSRDELLEIFGGRSGLAREIAGLPSGPLPRKGTPERRRYDAAMRALQRSERAGQINPRTGRPYQTRSGTSSNTARRIEAIGRAMRRRTELQETGGRVVGNALISVNGYPPKERAIDVFVTSADWRDIFALYATGRPEDGARSLNQLIIEDKGLYRGHSGSTYGITAAEVENIEGRIE